ncbi:hypothetical protein N422_08570 [Lacticaseibacillus paracasei]|nr:hypothetical protein N422_08570 [Lacticaseibacillus paracasei]
MDRTWPFELKILMCRLLRLQARYEDEDKRVHESMS